MLEREKALEIAEAKKLRGDIVETIMSELNIQFVIADGTIQIKDQVDAFKWRWSVREMDNF